MKLKYLIFFIIFNLMFVYSQINNNNNCGFAEYELIANTDKTYIKHGILIFSESRSEYVFNKVKEDSNKLNSDGNSISLNISSSDEVGSIIYRDFQTKDIVVRESKVGKFFDPYLYKDNWVEISWEIENDTMRISNFLCIKAKGYYRGRNYIAWFTEEIPLPYGPWKLYGLPGLILYAEDDEKMYSYSIKKITYPFNCDIEIKMPIASEQKTLKEFVEFKDNFHEHLFNRMKSKLPRNLANSFNFTPQKNLGRKYRDEKLFEWEE